MVYTHIHFPSLIIVKATILEQSELAVTASEQYPISQPNEKSLQISTSPTTPDLERLDFWSVSKHVKQTLNEGKMERHI